MNLSSTEFRRLSSSIAWVRFPLIMCVMLLHSYCTVPVPGGGHHLYFSLVYPFGLWLGESGVPTFFFISGFLFYVSTKSYRKRMASRVHTLLYPYLFWNSLFLCIYLALWAAGHPLDILGKSISDYGAVDYIRAYFDRGESAGGNSGPVLCTYWYVRNLFLLCMASPLWFYLNKYLKAFFPLLLTVWWMTQYHNALLAESIFFFNLGACFAINGVNPLSAVNKFRVPFLLLWAVTAVADLAGHTVVALPGAFFVHRLSLILNIFAFLLLGDRVTKGDRSKVNSFLAGSVFWIFALHDHLVIAFRRFLMARWGGASDLAHVALYWLTVVLVTAVCLVSYAVMKRLFPRLVKFATGSR